MSDFHIAGADTAYVYLQQALELLVANKDKISALGVGQCIGLVKSNNGASLYVNNNSGICDYLVRYNHHNRLEMASQLRWVFQNIIANWENYTDSKSYPIPMCREYTSKFRAEEQYDHCLDTESNMYSRRTEYGQLRWEAIEYVIKALTCQAELSNQ